MIKIQPSIRVDQHEWLMEQKDKHKEDFGRCIREALDLLIKKKNRELKR